MDHDRGDAARRRTSRAVARWRGGGTPRLQGDFLAGVLTVRISAGGSGRPLRHHESLSPTDKIARTRANLDAFLAKVMA